MLYTSWIDTHAHLADLDNQNLATCLENCKKHNVTTIINSATDINSSKIIAKQIIDFPNLYGTAGISPFDTPNVKKGWQGELFELLQKDKIIALGEIGLDNTNPIYPSIEIQKDIFLGQLSIAKELDIPVMLHSRGSEKEVLDHLLENEISKAIFHCYTGPVDLIQTITDNGYYISYSGIVTFNKAPLDEQVKATTLSKIFIETDSPYLAPKPFRGKKNEPALVSLVGEKVAELKKISPEELQINLDKNFKNIFSIENV